MTIQAKRRPGDALTPEDHSCEHLGPAVTTREQQRRAVDRVCQVLPDCPDCDTGSHNVPDPDRYCGRRVVLAALLRPPYKTPPGSTPRTKERVQRYNGVAAGGETGGAP